jgi:hypothetical protein
MKLSAFTLLLFLLSAALAMASLIGVFRPLTPWLSEYKYGLMLAGWGVLAFGIIFKGRSD